MVPLFARATGMPSGEHGRHPLPRFSFEKSGCCPGYGSCGGGSGVAGGGSWWRRRGYAGADVRSRCSRAKRDHTASIPAGDLVFIFCIENRREACFPLFCVCVYVCFCFCEWHQELLPRSSRVSFCRYSGLVGETEVPLPLRGGKLLVDDDRAVEPPVEQPARNTDTAGVKRFLGWIPTPGGRYRRLSRTSLICSVIWVATSNQRFPRLPAKRSMFLRRTARGRGGRTYCTEARGRHTSRYGCLQTRKSLFKCNSNLFHVFSYQYTIFS